MRINTFIFPRIKFILHYVRAILLTPVNLIRFSIKFVSTFLLIGFQARTKKWQHLLQIIHKALSLFDKNIYTHL